MRMRHALIAAATVVALGCGSSTAPPTNAPTAELAASVPDETVPAGTRLAVSFDTDLGPGLDFPGDLVRGHVLARLVDRDGDLLVPYGAVWEGRVESSDIDARTVTVRFERVQTVHGWAPFSARVVSAAPYALTVKPTRSEPGLPKETVTTLLGRTPEVVAFGGGPPVDGAPPMPTRPPLMPEIVVPANVPVQILLAEPLKLP